MHRSVKVLRVSLLAVVGGLALYGARSYRDDVALTCALAGFRSVEPDCRHIEFATMEDGWVLIACADQTPSLVRLAILAEEAGAAEPSATEDAFALVADEAPGEEDAAVADSNRRTADFNGRTPDFRQPISGDPPQVPVRSTPR